ncbi:Fic/DOC family protein [Xanthomonas fragariae]
MKGKCAVPADPTCYPGTAVLKNKLNIVDPDTLEVAEADFAATAVESIEIGAPPFDLDYLRNLHRQLFDEVYDWAGCLRTVDIAKGATRFCIASRIEPEANQLFNKLNSTDLAALPRSAQMRLIAELYGELNMIHPFREGNGRTQRLFFEHWLLLNGLAVSWKRVYVEPWIAACIAAVSCDYSPLTHLFDTCVSEIEEL